MKIVIPMAGFGDRFVNAGYKDPKPLIEVNGKKIIQHIVEMFDTKNDEFIFICNENHIANTNIVEVLRSLVSTCMIVSCKAHKLGPVYTLSKAFFAINDDENIIVSYCDNPFKWDYNNFKLFASNTNADGIIMTHKGFHPHSLNSTKMAFCKIDDQNNLIEIKEKQCYTNNHFMEHASTGMYYFKSGKNLKKYCSELIDRKISYNGEFYVTLVYNLLIENGLNVKVYSENQGVTVFGTPEELQSFNAWKTILTSGQVKDEKDLINCYKYWKEYHGYS